MDANGFRIRAALALNSRAFLTFHWLVAVVGGVTGREAADTTAITRKEWSELRFLIVTRF